MNEEELKKGCGNWIENYYQDGDHEHRDDIECGSLDWRGNPILCKSCQESQEEMKKNED